MAEVAVIGAVVGVGIRLVLDNLLPLPIEEIKQVWGFEKELIKLQNSLEMIRAFMLDAEVEQSDKHAVKLWLKRLEDVAFEADAVFDDFSYQLIRKKVENHDQGIKKVMRCFFLGPNLLFRRKMSHNIKNVCENLEAVNNEANIFRLQITSHSVQHASSSRLAYQTDSYGIEPNVVGRDNDVSTIVKVLVTVSTENYVSVIPIVGMGGLGKTAVAREVFHDEEIVSHFGVKIWVFVSVGFDDFTLFKMILQSLTKENVDVILTKEVVLDKIRQVLEGERYLLVLDDVWNQERYKWEGFINSLIRISPLKGNGIIVTTRLENVASIVGGISTHQLSRLSQDECWSIIKTKAFSRAVAPQEFEEIGKSIAKKCHGLPLAAKIVGGMLYGKSKDDWHYILKNQFSYMGKDEIRILEILKLSYDNLPSSSLKKCFMYCCVFPQNHLIEREQLIELWVAEGFLQADEENNMETVGNNFFNDLLQYSLFQDPHKDYYGNITNCRMHDLVHDVACSISGNRSINANQRGSIDTHRIRYFGLGADVIGHQDISLEQAKHIRTFFFNGTVAHNMFKRFKCLHVLKLTSFDITELPHAIRKMVQLRFLDISGTQIKELPDSIGKLYKLQTLRIYGAHIGLKKLPSTTVNLISLRHLHIRGSVQLPPEIGKLTSLQTLRVYKVGLEKSCGIGELGRLKDLKGELEIKNLERVHGNVDARLADLSGKSKIIKLVFVWNESGNGESNKDVLEGLHPHQNLKSLEIRGYRGANFPLWTIQMKVGSGIQSSWARLNNLIEIKLIQCDKAREIPMLGYLPSLKFLELMGMDNVLSIGKSFYGIGNCSIDDMFPFPALEDLVLSRMPNLTKWDEAEVTTSVFPCLKRLKMQNCPKLNGVPSHFPCLEELIIADVGCDFLLKNVCSSNLRTLQKLIIKSCPGLIHLPDWLFVMNKSLSSLEVLNCPKLTHLVRCMKDVGRSLRKLIVMDCENLRGLSLSNDVETFHPLEELSTKQEGFTSLEKLVIHGCERFTNTPFEVLDSCTSSLEELSFRFLDNFVDLSSVVPYLPRMSCIDNLELYNFSELVDLPTTNIRSISSSLRRLEIGGYSKSLSLVLFNQFLQCIFHGNPPLKYLTLYGQHDWESLPDQIHHLTALERLDLRNFGIEALPEWFGNLSSLHLLEVRNCTRLRHMPPREAMQCLTKLKEINILGCPLLAERCKNRGGGDSEWPNISHIEKVVIHDQVHERGETDISMLQVDGI